VKIFVTFEKRDWGGGRKTWRERPIKSKRGSCTYAVRALSNRASKRRRTNGEICIY